MVAESSHLAINEISPCLQVRPYLPLFVLDSKLLRISLRVTTTDEDDDMGGDGAADHARGDIALVAGLGRGDTVVPGRGDMVGVGPGRGDIVGVGPVPGRGEIVGVGPGRGDIVGGGPGRGDTVGVGPVPGRGDKLGVGPVPGRGDTDLGMEKLTTADVEGTSEMRLVGSDF